MSPWRGKSFRTELYAGAADSDVTSSVQWLGDAENISLFLRGSPSTTTVQLSNASGGHKANVGDVTIPETSWSNETVITSPAPDLLSVTAGARWLRTLRSETTEAALNWQR